MDHLLVEQLETRLRRAQLDGDVHALDQLIDDALLFAGPDGALATKADDLAMHRTGVVRFAEHEPLDLQWRSITDDVVAVSLVARLALTFHGQPVAGTFRYTRVWARRAGDWRVVAGAVSAIAG